MSTTPTMHLASDESVTSKDSQQTSLKLATPRRVRITVPQARALSEETQQKMLDLVKQRKDDFRFSLEWLAESKRFQDQDELIALLRKVSAGFDRRVLTTVNKALKDAYEKKNGKWYSEMYYPGVDSVVKDRTTEHLEAHFAPRLAELNIPVPTKEAIFNRILISTIPLTSTTALLDFQNQLITELSPRLGALLELPAPPAPVPELTAEATVKPRRKHVRTSALPVAA